MHKNGVFFAILVAVLVASCGVKQMSVQTPATPKVATVSVAKAEPATVATKLAVAKPARAKSALELSCESISDSREKAICLTAQSRELAEKARKVAEQARKAEPASVGQVRREVESAEQARLAARQNEARKVANAQVTGCPAGSVWVSDSVADKSRWRVMATVEVINVGALALDEIRAGAGYGVVVRNLCSGGSVTLHFVLRWQDSDQVSIPLTAIARPPDGGVATADFSTYLSRWNVQYNRVTSSVWQVRLNRQYQVR